MPGASTVFTLACLVALAVTVASAADVTADDIKKMKVKELKQFCLERDEECKDCVEKSDYVNAAIRVMGKKPDAVKKAAAGFTGEAPKAPLWEVWAAFAEETAKEIGVSEAATKVLKNVVEAAFMQHGKATATRLKKNHKDVLKTSLLSPYYNVGRKNLRGIAKFTKALGDKAKTTDVRAAYEKVFLPWMTNVGIENTNPMYEWLKGKDEL